MNEANRENLSALSDGELEFEQVRFMLRQVEHDAHLRASWSSYHVGRDCMRGEFSGLASHGFAERVMTSLDSREDIVVTPSGRRRWLQWSAGGAIAASVAAVALMVAQPRGPARAPDHDSRNIVATTTARKTQSARKPVARAPEVPRWLAASAAGQFTQQASASTLDGHVLSNQVMTPAAYSRHMAPYMSLRGYPSSAPASGRTSESGWINRFPNSAHPSATTLRRAH